MNPDLQTELIDAFPEAILLLSQEGKILAANRAAARLWRCKPAVLRQRTLQDLATNNLRWLLQYLQNCAASRQFLPGQLRLKLDSQDARIECEGAVFRPWSEGSPAVILLRLKHESPESNHFQLLNRKIEELSREIRERRIVEQEREQLLLRERELREQAELASRLKDEFLSVVSHELRTPLNHIYGWIKILRAGKIPADEISAALEVIERNAAAQNHLIEDLLDASRAINGKLQLEVREVEPADIVRSTLAAAESAALAKKIRLELRLDPRGGHVGTMLADPDRLRQIVWNLVSNAIKFTPRGGMVLVQVNRFSSHYEISVQDTGEGISAEFLPYVFDRFRQADGSLTRKQNGLGLGLAIVRHLVELHGGTVRVESPGVNYGATFRVMLPIRSPRTMPVPVAGTVTRSGDAAAAIDWDPLPHLNGLKILIVDDEADTRSMLLNMLSPLGVEIRTAESAAQALSTLESWKPDVLLSDIGMPEVNGYELIRKIRKSEQQSGSYLPAIALTAYGLTEDRMRAIIAGFQMHVTKPVDPLELIAVLASLSGRFT